jgi:hypothetical protein
VPVEFVFPSEVQWVVQLEIPAGEIQDAPHGLRAIPLGEFAPAVAEKHQEKEERQEDSSEEMVSHVRRPDMSHPRANGRK